MKKVLAIFQIIPLILVSTAYCQDWVSKPNKNKPVQLSGVRVGITYIMSNSGPNGEEEKKMLEKEGIDPPFLTQFGWQFERQFATGSGNNAAVAELVVLAGGFNQGKIIPSISGLIGYRLHNGFEFGGGPNITMTKKDGNLEPLPGFVWVAGYSTIVGNLYLPINLAVVQTISGLRYSLMTGFVW